MPTKARIREGDGDPRHGTYNGYNNLKCRGECCRSAARRHSGDVPLKIHLARVHAAAQVVNHGTSWAYEGKGCRCPDCREARRRRGQQQRDAKRYRDMTAGRSSVFNQAAKAEGGAE